KSHKPATAGIALSAGFIAAEDTIRGRRLDPAWRGFIGTSPSKLPRVFACGTRAVASFDSDRRPRGEARTDTPLDAPRHGALRDRCGRGRMGVRPPVSSCAA